MKLELQSFLQHLVTFSLFDSDVILSIHVSGTLNRRHRLETLQ
jgi:hypothetical protein